MDAQSELAELRAELAARDARKAELSRGFTLEGAADFDRRISVQIDLARLPRAGRGAALLLRE